MHGGAVTLARQFLEQAKPPDLILATDMLDLTTFLALTRPASNGIPVAVYFHENQLAYPWSPDDRDVQKNRDKHYGFLNYTTALSADAVFFNSEYNRQSFLSELEKLLKHFPDFRELQTIEAIRERSQVLHLGLDLARFNQHRPADSVPKKEAPLILWNHRWELDKNPVGFFKALYHLQDAGLSFEVAVLGECFSQQPQAFLEARKQLGERIVQFGYCDSFDEYASWLWRADLLPVTSNQDFFGGSVVEAGYCDCRPILPRRLAYPELLPEALHDEVFYETATELQSRLSASCNNPSPLTGLRSHLKQFDWSGLAMEYDDRFEEVRLSGRF